MKQANVVVHLSKDMNVNKSGVTPLEALLLTAEHHRNAGGTVIDAEAADKTATEVADYVRDTDGKVVMKDGKPVTKGRTDDEELDRLRSKYQASKVRVILAEVKEFPKDFKTAVDRGSKIVLPSSPLSQTKLI